MVSPLTWSWSTFVVYRPVTSSQSFAVNPAGTDPVEPDLDRLRVGGAAGDHHPGQVPAAGRRRAGTRRASPAGRSSDLPWSNTAREA